MNRESSSSASWVPIGSGRSFSMACRKTKLRRMCRSTDWRNAWPLLSRRLNRFVRQKPMSRLPARDRSAMTFAFGWRRRLVRAFARCSCPARSAAGQAVDRVDHVGRVEAGVLVVGFLSSILNLTRLGHAVGKYDRVPSVERSGNLRPVARVGLRRSSPG